MDKLTVGVVFGSRSTEHDVSIVTAIASIIKPLELSGRYNVIPIYIDKKGRWFSDLALKDIALFSTGEIEDYLAKHKPMLIRFGGKLEIVKPGLKTKSQKIDVIFPATHGTHGEDGELMGFCELANVAYVGCDMPSSVLSMDKAFAKIIATNAEIPTSKFVWFYAKDYNADQQGILKSLRELRYPLFVKPVHLGSSIAITRVKDQTELINAIEVAAHYDNKLIVEEAINNLIEVTVPIIGNDEPVPALVEQPIMNDDAFFDFETKYMSGGKKNKGQKQSSAQGYSKLPADLPTVLYKKAEETALRVYKALGCGGIARVDLLIDSVTKQVYFNEVNPLPGSLYEHNWRQSGKSSIKLVEELVDLALEQYQQKQSLMTSFDTNYLKQY